MNLYYRILHSGEPIAMVDTIEQARAIVRESRPGAYHILEVRHGPDLHPPTTRTWGETIHPDDGCVIFEPAGSAASPPV